MIYVDSYILYPFVPLMPYKTAYLNKKDS